MVTLVGRDAVSLDAAATAIGGAVGFESADVVDAAAVHEAFDRAAARHGQGALRQPAAVQPLRTLLTG